MPELSRAFARNCQDVFETRVACAIWVAKVHRVGEAFVDMRFEGLVLTCFCVCMEAFKYFAGKQLTLVVVAFVIVVPAM